MIQASFWGCLRPASLSIPSFAGSTSWQGEGQRERPRADSMMMTSAARSLRLFSTGV